MAFLHSEIQSVCKDTLFSTNFQINITLFYMNFWSRYTFFYTNFSLLPTLFYTNFESSCHHL